MARNISTIVVNGRPYSVSGGGGGGGSQITVDSVMSTSSTNPVQNKVITQALNEKMDASVKIPKIVVVGDSSGGPQTLRITNI